MLSPRTMSLRAKNRALLKALDQYTDIISDHTSSAHGVNFEDEKFVGSAESHRAHHVAPSEFISSFHKHLSAEDLRPRKPLQWRNSYIPLHKSETYINFDGNRHVNSLLSNVDVKDKNYPLVQNEKYMKVSSPLRPSALGSTGDLQAIVHEIISEMKEAKPLKTSLTLTRKSSGSRNSSTSLMKSVRGKSISLQQQRAAEAQMHAPTHSHLLSKCSCTDFGKVRANPDSKYVVQLYGHKQRIPFRLKRQRYRADSVSRPPRTVKWADTDPPIMSPTNVKVGGFTSLTQPHEDFKAGGDFSENHERNSGQVHSDCRESQSSFIDRVRTFRESHWEDCHASPRGATTSEHDCVHHYILNRRLFLEPVHTINGESSCPVCSLTSNQPERLHGHNTRLNYLASQPSKILVTLPTVLLEDSRSPSKSNVDASAIRQEMRKKERRNHV
ncbi:uncharacterized protein LOC117642108 [Thrips palmi]|uniref:Uncharacterized protein LOC117642108 n=1 Tax=Thrips palmi TaxID=161013 RepID=A0A6P8ZJS0_THRPL|nr:uncharacterized protein LOC117642108 [Thrips palmi]XP_034235840.1 uncharacterized protein LOC117642108 [Thrips palmi]